MPHVAPTRKTFIDAPNTGLDEFERHRLRLGRAGAGRHNKPTVVIEALARRLVPLLGEDDPLAHVIGDARAIRAHAADYDDTADFLHDETIACERCWARWYRPPPSTFDAHAWEYDGTVICGDCAAGHGSDVREGLRPPAAEHGTLYARNGAVVG